MNQNNYDVLKKESQRVNASVTALINIIIDNYVQNTHLKVKEDGE
jgi:hypothetical protein